MIKTLLKSFVIILILCGSCYAVIDLNGDADNLNCGTGASIANIFSGSGGTVACLVNVDSFQGGGGDLSYMIYKSDLSTVGWIFIIRDDGADANSIHLSVYGADDGFWVARGDAAEGVMMYFAVTFDGSSGGNTPVFYVNGVVSSVDFSSAMDSAMGDDSSETLYIGGRAGNTTRNVDGKYFECETWNKILTVDELKLLSDSKMKRMPLQIQPSSLKSYWPFDDKPDGEVSINGKTYLDISGNGNTCTGVDADGDSINLAETVLTYP